MGDPKNRDGKFNASKRDFLKKAVLMGIYIVPLMKTVEMAAIAANPSGPPMMKT
jgi:hypothetical protein